MLGYPRRLSHHFPRSSIITTDISAQQSRRYQWCWSQKYKETRYPGMQQWVNLYARPVIIQSPSPSGSSQIARPVASHSKDKNDFLFFSLPERHWRQKRGKKQIWQGGDILKAASMARPAVVQREHAWKDSRLRLTNRHWDTPGMATTWPLQASGSIAAGSAGTATLLQSQDLLGCGLTWNLSQQFSYQTVAPRVLVHKTIRALKFSFCAQHVI